MAKANHLQGIIELTANNLGKKTIFSRFFPKLAILEKSTLVPGSPIHKSVRL
jgi:hypothetical protein